MEEEALEGGCGGGRGEVWHTHNLRCHRKYNLDLRYLCGVPAIDSALRSWYGSDGGGRRVVGGEYCWKGWWRLEGGARSHQVAW